MLDNLEVLNGTLSLKFDPLNTKYTVLLNDKNDMALQFQYQVPDGVEVFITNNYLVNEYTVVILTVKDEDATMDYKFYVYKEDSTDVADYFPIQKSIEVEATELSPYAVPGISSICFLIILIVFAILFHKKKKRKL